MKMTTFIPHQITTLDRVDTPIGALQFFDGVPTRDTVDTVYDYLDRASMGTEPKLLIKEKTDEVRRT